MTITLGTSGGAKDVVAVVIGTPAGNRAVLAGHIGTPAGNKQFYSSTSPTPTPTPTPPSTLTVTISPETQPWLDPGPGPGHETDPFFAIVSGGTAPYSYFWSAPDGGATPGNPTGSSTYFFGGPSGRAIQVDVTDSLGATGSGFGVITG